MPNTNTKLKLLYIMRALLEKTDEKHTLSVKDLIDELSKYDIEAERKSVYSDIELLKDFDMDIECVKDRSNQYYVASRTFELPELKLLVDAVQSSKFITQKKSRLLIKKLETLCSVYEAKQLDRQVYVANRVKTMNESIYYNVDKIHNAINEGRQIRFKYFGYTIDKRLKYRRDGEFYEASPYALTWADDNYYLVAYYKRYHDISHFRVDRMLEIDTIDKPIEKDEAYLSFDIAEYSTRFFHMFTGKLERVELLFSNDLVDVVIDRFGKEITLQPVDDAHFKIIIQVVTGNTFLSWLFMFKDGVKIISPQHLKDEMRDYAKTIANLYV